MRTISALLVLLVAADAGAQQASASSPATGTYRSSIAEIAAQDARRPAVTITTNDLDGYAKAGFGAGKAATMGQYDAATKAITVTSGTFGPGYAVGAGQSWGVGTASSGNFVSFGADAPREMPYFPPPRFAPPKTTAAADAADSLYRIGQALLTAGEFRKAADAFASLAAKYPDSEFASDALYYRAYSLYKIGTSRELQLAVESLDRQVTRYPNAKTMNDAKQLRGSIMSEQARRGDSYAAFAIQEGATALRAGNRCPTDDDDMRLTALNGLQSDPDVLIPTLQKLLARTDECSVRLRKRAVYMIAQTKEEERSDILLRVANADPSVEVRREAVQWLAEVNTERAAKALDSILFTAKDAEIRDRALSALSRHRSPNARLSIMRFAEQTNVSTELRARAINMIGQSQRRTGNEAEFLQAFFNKTASPELRQAAIEAFANLKTPDRVQWLLSVARDRKQELEVRKRALFSASQNGVDLKDLFAMYGEMKDQPDMEDQLLYAYSQRKEPEVTDRLIEIAKTEKNPELKKKALFWLGSKKDPKVKQFLLEFISSQP